MTLSEKIVYCRRRSGLTQEALAEKLGVSRQAVSKWETGDAVPELGKLPLLAGAFGATADWLLSGEEPAEPAGAPAPAASEAMRPPPRNPPSKPSNAGSMGKRKKDLVRRSFPRKREAQR